MTLASRGGRAHGPVLISNTGKSDLELIGIEFLDIANNSIFASLRKLFYPLSDYRGDIITVKQKEKVTVNLTGSLPQANYGQFFIYQPCFTTTITDAYIIARDNIYESRQCYNQNETMLIFQCVSNDNCNANESCSFNKCVKLKCKNCQYVSSHKCVDYECCSSEQCEYEGFCRNNACEKLNCNFNEYVYNHTCKILNCAFNEFVSNRSCKKLECNFNERAFNHTCEKLNCSENEFIQNRSCKLLECKEEEYAKGHVCNPLQCRDDERIINHTCEKLNCHIFQDIINHECRNDKTAIFKMLMEIAAIAAIIAFFIIDFKKYEKKRHDNQIKADSSAIKEDKSEQDKSKKS